jgi:uncharacterized protein YndB with AHSA1/START domain
MKDVAIDPVVKKVRVHLGIEDAFRLFTQGMGQWWPLDTHSIAADTHDGRIKAEGLVFEGHTGGRIYERMSDGSEGLWGHVLLWEPPNRVVFSWNPSLIDRPHTEVEVRFFPAGDATDVELEHRGWERLGADGPGKRGAYDSGWPALLELFRAALAQGSPSDSA